MRKRKLLPVDARDSIKIDWEPGVRSIIDTFIANNDKIKSRWYKRLAIDEVLSCECEEARQLREWMERQGATDDGR